MTDVETPLRGRAEVDSANEGHAKRGRLNNGNPPGDYTKAPRCGARTRRGTRCLGPAMKNGRCRMHGGCSTGPKTLDGLARSQKANWKHGRCSEKARADKRELLAGLAWMGRCTAMLRNVDRLFRLLNEIAWHIDASEPKGLRKKCLTAAKLWREHQTVLNSATTEEQTQAPWSQTETGDRLVTLLLEAGAAGETPYEIWAKLSAGAQAKPALCSKP